MRLHAERTNGICPQRYEGTSRASLDLMETIEVPVKGVELEVEKGQGSVRFTIGPMAEKELRALAAMGSMGKLKVVIDANPSS